MDDVLISLTIGQTALLGLVLLLLFALGAGIAMAFLMRRRMMRGGGCPCMAMLRGEGHTRD